jgi:Tol biopolymer transport system component
MSKKIFLALSVAFVILLGFLIYYTAFKRKPTAPPEQSKITKVSNKKISFPCLSKDEKNIFYYLEPEAVFYQLSLTTEQIKSVSPMLSFIQNVTWGSNCEKTILRVKNIQAAKTESFFYTPDRPYEGLNIWVYDITTKNKILLNQNVKKAVWTADGKKIVYHYLDQVKGVNNLSIADPDGKNWKKVIDLKDENIFLNTLGTGEIVYATSETTDSFSAIKTDGSGKRTIKLPISVNINKIAWSSDGKSLIAAIREKDKATDALYKINLESDQKEEIKYESKTPIDAKNLMLTKDGKTLYFTSDDYLYKLEL